MTAEVILGWYYERLSDDAKAKAIAEEIYGVERQIFSEALGRLQDVLEQALGDGMSDELEMGKLAIANHAFGLLWSAWSEASAGRYSAATHHWRSIEEAPQYLKALTVEPTALERFRKGQLRISEINRIIKRALEAEKRGAGEEWSGHRGYHSHVQPLSHISRETTEGTLPLLWDDKGPRAVIKFGGGLHYDLHLRRIACALTDLALSLLTASIFAFKDNSEIGELWTETRDFIDQGQGKLRGVAKELHVEVDD